MPVNSPRPRAPRARPPDHRGRALCGRRACPGRRSVPPHEWLAAENPHDV